MDAEAIHEIFQVFGQVGIRRMFGGQGIYRDGVMFALEDQGELYLKVDGETVDHLRDLGSRPFSYETKNGRTMITSFWLMPASALDDPDEAAELARMSLGAALRSRTAKPRKAASSRRPRKHASESKA